MNAASLLVIDNATAARPLTRAEVCAVEMWFQGLRVTLPDYGTVPWFGPFINSLPPASRSIARAAERATGTHCLRQLSYGYSESDYTYPIPPADFTNDLARFRARLEEDRRAGLRPVVELAGDGQQHDPNGGTYGFPWLKANLERILDALGAVGDDCLFFHCWEAVNNGGWSPDNLFEMTLLHRRLRPRAHIAWHFSYAWPGDGSGGALGPVAEWSSPAGLACDVMLAEGDAPFITEDGTPIPGDALNGWQQRARCFLGPACNDALIDPANREPFYWTVETPRGPRVPVVLELDLFRDVRNRVSLKEINAERSYCRALNFPHVC